MKRVLVFVGVFCLMAGCAYADLSMTPAKSATDDSVSFSTGSTNTLYTKSIKTNLESPGDKIGVMYKGTGPTVDLRIELEQSANPPATEGSQDSSYLSSYNVDTSVTTSGRWELATPDTVVMPYIRFKVIGQGSNSSGTLTEIKVVK
jgi:hypothetical protein